MALQGTAEVTEKAPPTAWQRLNNFGTNIGKRIDKAMPTGNDFWNSAAGISPYLALMQQAPMSPFQMFTPEMAMAAIQQAEQFNSQFNAAQGTPTSGAGGVSTSGLRQVSAKEQREQAYRDFYAKKGLTEEQINKKVAKVLNTDKTFSDDKQFRQAVKKGEIQGLTVKDGKVKAPTKYEGAAANESQMSQGLRGGFQGLSQNALMAAQNLPFMYAQNEQRANAVRNMMTPMLMQQVGAMAGGGLNAGEQAGLDSIKNYYDKEYNSLFQSSVDDAYSRLYNTGFMQSSLVDDVLNKGALKPAGEYAVNAAASLAQMENQFRNSASQRQAQAIASGLGAFSGLGQGSGIGSVTGGIMSPGQAGLTTDPQTMALLAAQQNQGLNNMMANNAVIQGIMQKPITVMPEGGGFSATGALGGAVSGAKMGSMFGPLGTAVGGLAGGIMGGF